MILGSLYNLIIGPLVLLFESAFTVANRNVSNPGFAIIVLSLMMNIMVLPLYKRADAIQEEATAKEKRLAPVVNHIKKTFSGDEKFLLLQAYYRENNYRPVDSLRQTIPLLLQVPFFIAAYSFLSGLTALQGVSFGFIQDLGTPDGLIRIGTVTINLLPVLMTLINVISSTVYTRGQPLKSRIQLYVIALVFLVLLYTSPAGLVFYWTLNNLFSLGKNIVMKLIPWKKSPRVIPKNGAKPSAALFFMSAMFLASLMGFYIPSTIISSSPLEFLNYYTYSNPSLYLIAPFILAAGMFVFWGGVFYCLAPDIWKKRFEYIISVMAVGSVINYLAFNEELGLISILLKYEKNPNPGILMISVNVAVMAAAGVAVYYLVRKYQRIVTIVMTSGFIVALAMGALNCSIINYSYEYNVRTARDSSRAQWTLSTEGNNVLVIMMDRALSGVLPYAMNENPVLREQFDGFTYYPNTVSFGGHTNFACPALSGGYEYTPYNLNARDTEPLADKHDEALLVMPVLFSENGYDVTVVDPAYAGYRWIPDLSIYDDYPEIKAYFTGARYNDLYREMSASLENWLDRNLFCYSLFKCAPTILQSGIYNDGQYNSSLRGSLDNISYSYSGNSIAYGYDREFMSSYFFAENWDESTEVTADAGNHFVYLTSNLTHDPVLLSEPDYRPSGYVDNTEYDAQHSDRFVLDGEQMNVATGEQMAHYQTNVLALMELGNYFDYLRASGCYDNTRIIVVSDHGIDLGMFDNMLMDIGGPSEGALSDIEHVNPLMMVKDFNDSGFSVSYEFMTNADTPFLAAENLIENPVNPFTGNPLNNDSKYGEPQMIFYSDERYVDRNNGNIFIQGRWYSVQNDIMDDGCWDYIGEW